MGITVAVTKCDTNGGFTIVSTFRAYRNAGIRLLECFFLGYIALRQSRCASYKLLLRTLSARRIVLAAAPPAWSSDTSVA